MSRRVQENLVAALVFMVFIGVIVLCQDYGPRARMVPLPLAVFGAILMAAQIIWQNVRPPDELHVDLLEVLTAGKRPGTDPGQADATLPAAPEIDGRPPWRREANAFAIVIAFLCLILLLGPIVALFLFTGGYFLISRHYSWRRGLVYTVIFAASIYLLFVVALELQLYHGILEPLFRG